MPGSSSPLGLQARRNKQVLFFSATWPPSVERAARRLLSSRSNLRRVLLEPGDGDVEPTDGGLSLPPTVIEQIVEVVGKDDHEPRQKHWFVVVVFAFRVLWS